MLRYSAEHDENLCLERMAGEFREQATFPTIPFLGYIVGVPLLPPILYLTEDLDKVQKVLIDLL